MSARLWFGRIRELLARVPLSLIQLAMRISVGSVFFKAGLLKYHSFEFAVKLFEDEYKVPLLDPAVAARFAMFNELTWPVLKHDTYRRSRQTSTSVWVSLFLA